MRQRVTRDRPLGVLPHRLQGHRPRRGPLGQDHGGTHELAHRAVGKPHHGDVGHALHGADRRLHLTGVDVEAAGEDQLALTVGHPQEGVLPAHDVARAQPASRQDRGLRGRLVLPVAGEDLGAAHQQLARLAVGHLPSGVRVLGVHNAYIRGWERQAQRTQAARGPHRCARDDRTRLSHAVALDEEAAGRLLPPGPDLRRHRGRPAHPVAQGVQVRAPLLGAVEDPLEHDRHADEEGEGAPLVRGQDLIHRELGQHHLGGGLLHRAEEVEGQPEGVEEGQQAQEVLPALMQHRHPGDGLVGVGPQIGVREHRRLGGAGRPAGVQQDCDVGAGRVGEA